MWSSLKDCYSWARPDMTFILWWRSEGRWRCPSGHRFEMSSIATVVLLLSSHAGGLDQPQSAVAACSSHVTFGLFSNFQNVQRRFFHYWFQVGTHRTRYFSVPVTSGKPQRASLPLSPVPASFTRSAGAGSCFCFQRGKEWLGKGAFFTLFHPHCQGKYCCGLCQFWIILFMINISLWLLLGGMRGPRCTAKFPVLLSHQSEGQQAGNVTC